MQIKLPRTSSLESFKPRGQVTCLPIPAVQLLDMERITALDTSFPIEENGKPRALTGP